MGAVPLWERWGQRSMEDPQILADLAFLALLMRGDGQIDSRVTYVWISTRRCATDTFSGGHEPQEWDPRVQ
jgi:hypothetical protein